MSSSKNSKPAVFVTALRIHNVMGLTDMKIEPGKVTIVRGSNGVGKSTIIESLKAVLKGGHDATLLRSGEESGEIVMVLSDGTEIEKRIRPADSKTKVTHPDFGQLSKPAAFLDNLRDVFAVNPVDFLTAKPEKRVELLLSAIPMKVNPVDLAGIAELCSSKPDLSRHALQALAAIQKDLEDQRRDINRSAKEKRASILEMAKALPPEAGADGKVILESVEVEYADFRASFENEKSSIVAVTNDRVNDLKEELRLRLEDAARACTAEIDAIRKKYEAGTDALRGASAMEIDSVTAAARKRLDSLSENRAAKTQEFESALATARANADAFIRSQSARDHIARMETGAETLEADSETLSGALAELDAVRGNLLETLPIKGVTLVDGDVFVDGLPFDRVNESRRIRLAIEVAMLRSGSLPFIVVDGAERLDGKSLGTLADVAVEMGIQMVLAMVQDGQDEDGQTVRRPLEVNRIA